MEQVEAEKRRQQKTSREKWKVRKKGHKKAEGVQKSIKASPKGGEKPTPNYRTAKDPRRSICSTKMGGTEETRERSKSLNQYKKRTGGKK